MRVRMNDKTWGEFGCCHRWKVSHMCLLVQSNSTVHLSVGNFNDSNAPLLCVVKIISLKSVCISDLGFMTEQPMNLVISIVSLACETKYDDVDQEERIGGTTTYFKDDWHKSVEAISEYRVASSSAIPSSYTRCPNLRADINHWLAHEFAHFNEILFVHLQWCLAVSWTTHCFSVIILIKWAH